MILENTLLGIPNRKNYHFTTFKTLKLFKMITEMLFSDKSIYSLYLTFKYSSYPDLTRMCKKKKNKIIK